MARSDGRPALSMSILKETDADAVEISHTISDLLPDITSGLGQNASISRSSSTRPRRSSSPSTTWPSRAGSA